MELSQHQRDDLLLVNARKSEDKNLQPLTKLAMRAVARDIDTFASLDNPFEYLPRTVLEDMLRYPPLAPLLRCPKYAHLMVSSLTKHAGTVVLDFTSSRVTWTEEDVERVCSLIEESSAIVRRLVIYLDRLYHNRPTKSPHLSTERLHELLKHLPHLDTFRCDLEGAYWCCGVTNETVRVLAKNCPKLRVLEVASSPLCCISLKLDNITAESITTLCGACPGLEVFDVCLARICRWDQTLEFLLPLMPRLWRMREPCHSEALHSNDMITYLQRHGPTHPQLRYGLEYPREPHLVEAVDTIAECFPRCQGLYAVACSNLDLTPALKFKELRNVRLCSIEGDNTSLKDTFPVLLARNSLTLCSLDDVQNYSLDLSLIAHHCPELDYLDLTEIGISKNQQFEIQPYHFQSLTRVHLSKLILPPVALHTVARIMSSPHLVFLTVSSITLPDVVFSSLVQEARVGRQVFSSLENLWLEKCRVRPETLMDVLLQAPRLRELILSKVDKEHYKSVAKFVKKHMKHVTFEWMWEEDDEDGDDDDEEEED